MPLQRLDAMISACFSGVAVATPPLYFEVFTFKDFSEMILAAITVTILFELLVERAFASETFLLISRPGHVGNVFTIEFIVHDLLYFHLVLISINGTIYRKLVNNPFFS